MARCRWSPGSAAWPTPSSTPIRRRSPPAWRPGVQFAPVTGEMLEVALERAVRAVPRARGLARSAQRHGSRCFVARSRPPLRRIVSRPVAARRVMGDVNRRRRARAARRHAGGTGVDVAVFSANATAIEFCLFEASARSAASRLPGRTGDVFHGHIAGIAPARAMACGRTAPRAGGGPPLQSREAADRPLCLAIDRPFTLHPAMFGYLRRSGGRALSTTPTARRSMPKAIVCARCAPRRRASSRRGVARSSTSCTFAASPRAIADSAGRCAAPSPGSRSRPSIEHLVRLGVTTVEIMPAAAWIEERHLADVGLRTTGATTPSRSWRRIPAGAGGWDEVRATVAALAEAGIETIARRRAEPYRRGRCAGPTLSLRGLDNASLLPSGAGRSVALYRRYRLRQHAGVRPAAGAESGDGCAARLGGAAAACTASGSISRPRSAAAQAVSTRRRRCSPRSPGPGLRELKLIAEPWDVGPGVPVGRVSRRRGASGTTVSATTCAVSGAATPDRLGELAPAWRARRICSRGAGRRRAASISSSRMTASRCRSRFL